MLRNLLLTHVGASSRLRDSLILWYNIEKQAATNRMMSSSPYIIDLSEHGFNATCYNFAWNSTDSGISDDGALISDGVDDYALTENIPSFENGQGLTILARRESIGGYQAVGTLVSDKSGWTSYSFSIEAFNSTSISNKQQFTNLFAHENSPGYPLFDKDIIWLNSYGYCGMKLPKGNTSKGNGFVLFFAGNRTSLGQCGKFKLWSFVMFNRDLTTYEIEVAKRLYL